jgi:hypothetical protein
LSKESQITNKDSLLETQPKLPTNEDWANTGRIRLDLALLRVDEECDNESGSSARSYSSEGHDGPTDAEWPDHDAAWPPRPQSPELTQIEPAALHIPLSASARPPVPLSREDDQEHAEQQGDGVRDDEQKRDGVLHAEHALRGRRARWEVNGW